MTDTKTDQAAWFQEMRKLYLISPLHAHFGLSMRDVSDGKIVLDVAGKKEFLNAHGILAGSVITGVIDSALLQVVRTRCAAEDFLTTLELKVNFVAPAKGMSFRCEANLIKAGGSTGVSTATVFDANDEPVATGLGTIFIRRKK